MDTRRVSELIGRAPAAALLPVLVLTLMLQGCGGSDLVRRGIDAVRTDMEITDQANRALVAIVPLSEQSRIIVTTYDRVVLLTGQTPRPAWRRQAQQTVAKDPRVRQMYNELTVAAPASLPTLTRDTLITSTVMTRLLQSDQVAFSDVKVVSESGIVYLMGRANRQQADAAAELARRVDGVKKVVLLFEEG